jgi:hypothetical protein
VGHISLATGVVGRDPVWLAVMPVTYAAQNLTAHMAAYAPLALLLVFAPACFYEWARMA